GRNCGNPPEIIDVNGVVLGNEASEHQIASRESMVPGEIDKMRAIGIQNRTDDNELMALGNFVWQTRIGANHWLDVRVLHAGHTDDEWTLKRIAFSHGALP